MLSIGYRKSCQDRNRSRSNDDYISFRINSGYSYPFFLFVQRVLSNVFYSRGWDMYLKQSQGDTINQQFLHLRRRYGITIDVSVLLTC
jgi:hypothetical protein